MDALPDDMVKDEPAELRSHGRGSLFIADPRTGCETLLRGAGLKPTRQRLLLVELLFAKGDRHVTAEQLYGDAVEAKMQLSLATVYNTLNQFTEAGLLRRIGADGIRSFFDTNTSVHPHFYLEDEGILIDIPGRLVFDFVPDVLPGYELSRFDVIVHLRRKPES